MKRNIAIHTLFFAFLMMVSASSIAQDYVLTARGDSLTGQVKPMLFGPEKKVYLVGPDKDKKSFSIFEVRAFSHDGNIYHPVKGEQGYVFMRLLHPGYLSLYAYQPENQTRFDGLFLKKIDGDDLIVPNLGFRKYVSAFLEDCPDVATRVKEGDLGKKNLRDLIDAYNACIDSRSIDHDKIIAGRKEQTNQISVWDSMEEKIREKDFNEKNNALEMIAEIRKKILRQETIPNFLVEGLKNSLKDTGLSAELDQALAEINP